MKLPSAFLPSIGLLLTAGCRRDSAATSGPEASSAASTRPPFTAPSTRESDALAGVTLSCTLEQRSDALVFQYRVGNHSPADIYVMDADPSVDPATRRAKADREAVVIWRGAGGEANVLKGIAPLPTDRDVNVGVIPLAARVAAGATLTRSLAVALPLTETGPYHAKLARADYEPTPIPGVVLVVELLRSSVEGFAAEPASYAPDLHVVRGKFTVGQAERLSCAFPLRGAHLLVRRDAFPRTGK